MDAYDHDRLTAGRGLFLVLFSVPHPFSAADPHWPLPSKVPAFPHGNAGTRRRFSSFPPAVWHTQIAGGKEENLRDRKSTRLNSSHVSISYAVFCWKKKNLN